MYPTLGAFKGVPEMTLNVDT